jgi:hypothetical protein
MRSVSGVFKDAPDKAISIARLPSSTDASLTTTRTFERENIAEGLAKAISIARLPSLADESLTTSSRDYYGGFVVMVPWLQTSLDSLGYHRQGLNFFIVSSKAFLTGV